MSRFLDEEALAARSVARSVDEPDRHVADQQLVAALLGREVTVGHPGAALDPLDFVLLTVDLQALRIQELADSLHGRHPHEVAADVVRVVVSGQGAGHLHPIGFHHFEGVRISTRRDRRRRTPW